MTEFKNFGKNIVIACKTGTERSPALAEYGNDNGSIYNLQYLERGLYKLAQGDSGAREYIRENHQSDHFVIISDIFTPQELTSIEEELRSMGVSYEMMQYSDVSSVIYMSTIAIRT